MKSFAYSLIAFAALALTGCVYGPEEMGPPPVAYGGPGYGTITITNAGMQPMEVTYNHWHMGEMDAQHVLGLGPQQSQTFQVSYENTTFRVVRIFTQGQSFPEPEACSVNLEPDQLNGTLILNPNNPIGEQCVVNYN